MCRTSIRRPGCWSDRDCSLDWLSIMVRLLRCCEKFSSSRITEYATSLNFSSALLSNHFEQPRDGDVLNIQQRGMFFNLSGRLVGRPARWKRDIQLLGLPQQLTVNPVEKPFSFLSYSADRTPQTLNHQPSSGLEPRPRNPYAQHRRYHSRPRAAHLFP